MWSTIEQENFSSTKYHVHCQEKSIETASIANLSANLYILLCSLTTKVEATDNYQMTADPNCKHWKISVSSRS